MKPNLAKRNCILFSVLIAITFFQSCVVYQQTPTLLNNAVNIGKVKLVSLDGTTYKFKGIEYKKGVYYGVGDVYSDLPYSHTSEGLKTPIDTVQLGQVFIKDKKKSKNRTALLIVGVSITTAYLTIIPFIFLVSGL